MFERLKATVADHAVCLSVLDCPETPAELGLMLNLQFDLARNIRSRVWADPALDLRMLVNLLKRIEIVGAQRPQAPARGEERKRWRAGVGVAPGSGSPR